MEKKPFELQKTNKQIKIFHEHVCKVCRQIRYLVQKLSALQASKGAQGSLA